MVASGQAGNVLVMGVGNTLMRDDGAGIRVIETLRQHPESHPSMRLVDGGTIGLALLPQLEDADAVIVVDASELGAAPGAVRVLQGEEINKQLNANRRSVHEVALLDLFAAAAMRRTLPEHRALVGIQPGNTDWGNRCTPPVEKAIREACKVIQDLAFTWTRSGAVA